MRAALFTTLLALFCSVYGRGVAARAPDFPAPPNASVEIVGENMIVGGRAMSIRQFYTRDRMEKVKDFYARKWDKTEDGKKPGFIETDASTPWHIITRVEDGYLMTVQVQRADDGGSWGYLGVSLVTQEPSSESLEASVPRPPGSQVLHTMQTEDAGQSADTVMLQNQQSLSSNVNYYRQYYQQRNWRADMDKAVPATKMHILAFTKGRDKINIVLTGDQNKTNIVANRITHDIL